MYESTIIDKSQVTELIELCEFPDNQKFMLLYSASKNKNGHDFDDFHIRCDGVKNTLTIIRTSQNYIFGGYTDAAWDSADHDIEDPNSFIFSLKNCDNSPFKASCTDSKTSIYGGSDYGPTFGFSDIELGSCFLNKLYGSSTMGYNASYENPLSKSYILAGAEHFSVINFEVYELVE